MDVLIGLAGLLVGLVLGALIATRWRRRAAGSTAPELETGEERGGALEAGVAEVCELLHSGALVVDDDGEVLLANGAAAALGLVRDGSLVHPHLRDVARAVRRGGEAGQGTWSLARGPFGEGTFVAHVRCAPLDAHHVLLLVEDRSHAIRVEAVRRDFLANVSHELKTPVGGISLLAEAVLDASEDVDAVTRFARRIVIESNRLTRLVQEIVDLSRLQASESLDRPVPVDIAAVVHEALELVCTLAESRHSRMVVSVEDDLVVMGDAVLLRTALTNLLTNALNYSPEHTRVAVAARAADDVVEIAVTDQGCGIAQVEQERIFERFYRIDTARSRATGGTGLGLAIVKHICVNHGGQVRVWSSEGNGSTFTIRLPLASPDALAAVPTRGRLPELLRTESNR